MGSPAAPVMDEQPKHQPVPDLLAAVDAEIRRIIDDPSASRWLRGALRDAVCRDPLDAAEDARVLDELMKLRLNTILLAAARPPRRM